MGADVSIMDDILGKEWHLILSPRLKKIDAAPLAVCVWKGRKGGFTAM